MTPDRKTLIFFPAELGIVIVFRKVLVGCTLKVPQNVQGTSVPSHVYCVYMGVEECQDWTLFYILHIGVFIKGVLIFSHKVPTKHVIFKAHPCSNNMKVLVTLMNRIKYPEFEQVRHFLTGLLHAGYKGFCRN